LFQEQEKIVILRQLINFDRTISSRNKKYKQQQVQRDETNKYAGASFTKILVIQKALNLEVREELIFK
jgi:hypothetical protein